MTLRLPIDDVIPSLIRALGADNLCILQAPPGAGKTTRVPLELLSKVAGRILLLEPRRLAARAAAERMAKTLGEPAGATIGYRMRGDAKVSANTRIEVLTEGILTRMLQSEPDLPGVSVVIFDEFHERSLQADLGLALTWEARQTLRPDLKLIVMSATLDAGPVAKLLGNAPVVTSDGQSFPVEPIWLTRPRAGNADFCSDMADLIVQATQDVPGGLLAFLPGAGEIERTRSLLSKRFDDDVQLCPLYGALPFAAQRKALQPAGQGRKIVLASSIAETSLTIEDVRIVVDGGLARRARFDAASGMSRLVTEPVSRAEAAQRQGRAGRVAPGRCYKLWARAADGALPAYPPAEIEAADLCDLALSIAAWGTPVEELAFLTPPPAAALREARDLLTRLGAINAQGQVTALGETLAKIPAHPRLAHMLVKSGKGAAELAALLGERDPLPRDSGTDLNLRLTALQRARLPNPVGPRILRDSKRLERHCAGPKRSTGEMAALAYPDRIAMRRPGPAPRFVLSGGKGANMDQRDPLANAGFLVAVDLSADGRDAKIRLAAPVDEAEIRALYSEQITWQDLCEWSKTNRTVEAKQQETLGALVLRSRHWPDAPQDQITQALLEGLRDLGLQALDWSKSARALRARVRFLAAQGADMPDWSDNGLLDTLEDWFAPFADALRNAEDLSRFNPKTALLAALGWQHQQQLDELAPPAFTTPVGRSVALNYGPDGPELSVRLQEMFGLRQHPTIGPDQLPLKITLLSPAQRPVQVTRDLPGFWATSYADVRKDMRGRYPKHHWPEDPTQADPTLRAKSRKN
ncbi:MAG: ATP-dependent helicase HrpB [Pseudomonadota bacterium]